MIRMFAFVVVSALVSLAQGQEKPKDQKEPSPSEVVKRWIDAAVVVYRLRRGDVIDFGMAKLVREAGAWKVIPHGARLRLKSGK